MAKLFGNHDGANAAAQAVRAYLSHREGVDSSWCHDAKRYLAEPEIDRWHNCREQGYVVSLVHWGTGTVPMRQLNVVFYEHRNSDAICVFSFETGSTLNPVTLRDLPDGTFSTSHDYDVSFSYTGATEAADYIFKRLDSWWAEREAMKK